MSIRQEKFGKMIQKELAEIFMQNRSAMFNNAFITVSGVNVSPDLGYAKVYLSFFNEKNKEELLRTIELQNVQIRRELASRIRKQVRVIPELQFFIDDSLDYVFKMEKLFDEIKKKDQE
ncbi:MAG: 30S ribosome-binding factor RbfA [Bacteroidota bacterium]|jgi:ribosome-binding factor A